MQPIFFLGHPNPECKAAKEAAQGADSSFSRTASLTQFEK